MKRLYKILLGLLMLGLVQLACGPSKGAAPTPTAPKATQPVAEATATPEEEVLSLEKITTGLEALQSYRIVWTMKFEGKDSEGNPVSWSIKWQQEAVKEPPAHSISLEGSGKDVEELSGIRFVQVGDKQYVLIPGQGCVTTTPEEPSKPVKVFSPDDFGGISGAKLVGTETVNGIKAKHYTFNEKALGPLFQAARAKGDIWVAVEGNYIVKYVLEAEGGESLFGKGEQGKLTWEYQVTDINQPITIEPPEECLQALPEDIPILPDAAGMSTFAGFITYTTSKSFEEALNFYKAEMKAKGWTPTGEPMVMGNTAMLTYTKDGRTAQVMLSEEEGKVTVSITIQGE